MFKCILNKLFIVLIIVAVNGNDENNTSRLEDERSSNFTEILLPLLNVSIPRVDASEVTLIERTADKVKADNILSGMETLKENPLVSRSDPIQETSDEPLERQEKNKDDSKSAVEIEEDKSVDVIEKLSARNADYIETSSVDVDSSLPDFDPFDDLPLTRRKLKENTPVESTGRSRVDITSRKEDKHLESGNTKQETAIQRIDHMTLSSCCDNGMPVQPVPKDPIIAPFPTNPNYHYSPYPVNSYTQNTQLPLNYYSPVPIQPTTESWYENIYPFSSTLSHVIPNMPLTGQQIEQKMLYSNDHYFQFPLPYKPFSNLDFNKG